MSRNVDALVRLLADLGGVGDLRTCAEALAARGVLAVDALTDEQAGGLAAINPIQAGEWAWETPEAFRAALRRCATGEDELVDRPTKASRTGDE